MVTTAHKKLGLKFLIIGAFVIAAVAVGGIAVAANAPTVRRFHGTVPACAQNNTTGTFTASITNDPTTSAGQLISSAFVDTSVAQFKNIQGPFVVTVVGNPTKTGHWFGHAENETGYSTGMNDANDKDGFYVADDSTIWGLAPNETLTVSFTATVVNQSTLPKPTTWTDSAWTGSMPRTGSSFTFSGNAASRTTTIRSSCQSLSFSTQPNNSGSSTIKAGYDITTAVTVKDPNNNPQAGVAVTLSLNYANGATLSGTLTATSGVNGVASFPNLTALNPHLYVDKVGSGYTLHASTGSATADSSAFSIGAGDPNTLSFSTGPELGSPYSAGQDITAAVTVKDGFGNLVPNYQVTLGLNNPNNVFGAVLGGTTQTNTNPNGVATFPVAAGHLFVNKIGAGYFFTATAGSASVNSNPFDVTTPAAAAMISFNAPLNATYKAGQTISSSLTVTDAYGNPVPNVNVTISLHPTPPDQNPNQGNLYGTSLVSTNTDSNGVAAFPVGATTLYVDKIGSGYWLTGSASGVATAAVSTSFDILLGDFANLEFVQQPTNTVAGATMAPPVTVAEIDAGGNVITTDSTSKVALTFGVNAGGASTSFGGDPTVVANGIATFSNISINKSSSNYTLVASSDQGVPSATSAFFDILSAQNTGCSNCTVTTTGNNGETISATGTGGQGGGSIAIIVESTVTDCGLPTTPVAGTVTIEPTNITGDIEVTFDDPNVAVAPDQKYYPVCKTVDPGSSTVLDFCPHTPFLETEVPCIEQQKLQFDLSSKVAVLTASNNLHTVIVIKPNDPHVTH
jgi:hypothetical protein